MSSCLSVSRDEDWFYAFIGTVFRQLHPGNLLAWAEDLNVLIIQVKVDCLIANFQSFVCCILFI